MSRAAALVVLLGAGGGLALAALYLQRSAGGGGGINDIWPDSSGSPVPTSDTFSNWTDTPLSLDLSPYVGDLPLDDGTYTAAAEGEVTRATDETLIASTGGLADALAGGFYQARAMLFGMTMRTSAGGVERIKMHEGFVAHSYMDQAGKPTIGYGHLIRAGESFPGPITEARAREILASDLSVAESAVNGGVTQRITQNQFDALVSFVFNVGAEAFRISTLRRLLNAGDVAGAAQQFKRWNKVQQGNLIVASAGLTARRTDEAALFSQGIMV